MKEIAVYILIALSISLAIMGNVVCWMVISDGIKERIKNRKHD